MRILNQDPTVFDDDREHDSCTPNQAVTHEELEALGVVRETKVAYRKLRAQLATAHAADEVAELERSISELRSRSRQARAAWREANRVKMVRLGHI